MGYCYQGNKLCCDICGKAGARKVPCPFGYCPATATCPECRKAHPEYSSKAFHREHGCEQAHLAYVAQQQARAAAIASGEYCLRAALHVGELPDDPRGVVQVIFQGKDGERGVFMPGSLYDRREGSCDVTLSFFEQLHGGPLPIAPVDFDTKQIPLDALQSLFAAAFAA